MWRCMGATTPWRGPICRIAASRRIGSQEDALILQQGGRTLSPLITTDRHYCRQSGRRRGRLRLARAISKIMLGEEGLSPGGKIRGSAKPYGWVVDLVGLRPDALRKLLRAPWSG